MSVLIALVPSATAIAIWATGIDAFAFAPLFIYYGVIPFLDFLVGEAPENPTVE